MPPYFSIKRSILSCKRKFPNWIHLQLHSNIPIFEKEVQNVSSFSKSNRVPSSNNHFLSFNHFFYYICPQVFPFSFSEQWADFGPVRRGRALKPAQLPSYQRSFFFGGPSKQIAKPEKGPLPFTSLIFAHRTVKCVFEFGNGAGLFESRTPWRTCLSLSSFFISAPSVYFERRGEEGGREEAAFLSRFPRCFTRAGTLTFGHVFL